MRNFEKDITVTVDRLRLIERLKENKVSHRAKFEKALEGWRKETVALLNSIAENIKNNKPNNIYCFERPPADMSKEYETAIDMFSWDTNDKVDLDRQQFNAFVRDDWEWSSGWVTTNSKYLG